MLLTREEMTFDFGGARFDVRADQEVLAWAFNQFLYGEMTGIQVGHWLYHAPTFDAARFLAQQAIEELQHVDNFLRCLAIVGKEPEAPNRIVRFLTTGAMPDTWPEHVSQEMAVGEGLVLMCFYAMIDTVDDEEIVRILKRAVKQEERHVSFGEQETMRLIDGNPKLRRRLLGLNLVSLWAARKLARHMEKILDRNHPVLSQIGPFLEASVRTTELRLMRMGMLHCPLAEISKLEAARYVAEAHAAKAARAVAGVPGKMVPGLGRPSRLTDTYLADPTLRQAMLRAKSKGDRTAAA